MNDTATTMLLTAVKITPEVRAAACQIVCCDNAASSSREWVDRAAYRLLLNLLQHDEPECRTYEMAKNVVLSALASVDETGAFQTDALVQPMTLTLTL